jgi:hypothetical protein
VECEGEGRGEAWSKFTISLAGLREVGRGGAPEPREGRSGDWEFLPLVEAGVVPDVDWASGVGILTGRGKRGPLSFLRRGRRKNVVVVETVCVVMVAA